MPRNDNPTNRQALLDDLERVSIMHLVHLNRAIQQVTLALDLSYTKTLLLIFIDRGYVTPSELSEVLGLKISGVSLRVKQLEEAGLIRRQTNEADRRSVLLKLTSKGATACRKIEHTWRDFYSVDFERFSDEELKEIIAVARVAAARGLS